MRVQLNGISHYYKFSAANTGINDSTSSSDYLFCIHGGPGLADCSMFDSLVADLVNYHHVFRFDLRGSGASDSGPESSWNMKQWSRDIDEISSHVKLPRHVVFGVSFGGFLAMLYAARRPEKVDKLILCSTAVAVDVERISDGFRKIGGNDVAVVAERFWSRPSLEGLRDYRTVCGPFYTQTPRKRSATRPLVNQKVALAAIRECINLDLREVAAKIRCPVLILSGSHDPITPVEDALLLQEALVNSPCQLRIIENSGHPVYFDRPSEAVQAILEFLG